MKIRIRNEMNRQDKGHRETLVEKIEIKVTDFLNHFSCKWRQDRESLKTFGYKCNECKKVENLRRISIDAVEWIAERIFLLPTRFCIPSQTVFSFGSGSIRCISFSPCFRKRSEEEGWLCLCWSCPQDTRVSQGHQLPMVASELHNKIMSGFVRSEII